MMLTAPKCPTCGEYMFLLPTFFDIRDTAQYQLIWECIGAAGWVENHEPVRTVVEDRWAIVALCHGCKPAAGNYCADHYRMMNAPSPWTSHG